MFLSPDELRDLTDYRRARDQIRWLRTHGFPFEVGASGRPKVLRAELERRLSNREGHSRPREPRLSLLNE